MKVTICEEIRNLIKSKLDDGCPVTELSKMFKVSRTTIYSIRNDKELKKRGRKSISANKKFIQQVKRAIIKTKKSKKRVTSTKIHQNLPDAPSLSTVQRCLRNSDEFVLRTAKRKLRLTEAQKLSRVNLIKQWFRDGIAFERVIFTDEVRFSLDGPDNCLSWELHDENNDHCRNLHQQKGGSILCYMALSKDGIIVSKKIDGIINSTKYIHIIQDVVLPILRAKYKDNFILQQDNASPHTSKATKKFLIDSNIQMLNWPSRSPDMSLIENIFKSLKDLVYGTEDFLTKDDLWNEIKKCVDYINENKKDMIKDLYGGISDRFLNVVFNQGNN